MKLYLDPKKIWTTSLVIYIICSSAFSYGSLRMLNTYALYLFLGVSLVNILLRQKVKINLAIVSIILYTILLIIGALYTPTPITKVLDVMYKYITMVVIVFFVVQYIDSIRDIKVVMLAYMLAGFALAVYVYAQYGSEFWVIMQEAAEYTSDQVDRLGSELTNANTIGMFTIISAMIAAYNVVFDRSSKWKTVGSILIGSFCFMVSMAAASKKSIVVLLISLIVMWLYGSKNRTSIFKRFRSLLYFVGFLVVFVWAINTLPIFSGIATRIGSLMEITQGGSGTVSEQNRLAFIERGLEIWQDHMLFGDGTAASISYFGVYSHNNFVEILMNTGIVGFVLFYAAYPVAVHKYVTNAKRYKSGDRIAVLLFALFIGVAVCGFALVYYYERYYMILLTAICSAIQVFDTNKKSETEQLSEGDML